MGLHNVMNKKVLYNIRRILNTSIPEVVACHHKGL
jgi:hypothetical protein